MPTAKSGRTTRPDRSAPSLGGRLEADYPHRGGARCSHQTGIIKSGRGEPDPVLPDGFAPWVVSAETLDTDLEATDSDDLAVLACQYDIDLADGPGGLLAGQDDTDAEWRRWVIAEITKRQTATGGEELG